MHVCTWRVDFRRRDTWGPEKTLHVIIILDVNTTVRTSSHVTWLSHSDRRSPTSLCASDAITAPHYVNVAVSTSHLIERSVSAGVISKPTPNWSRHSICGYCATLYRDRTRRSIATSQSPAPLSSVITVGKGVAWPGVCTRASVTNTVTAQRHRAGQQHRAQLTFYGGVAWVPTGETLSVTQAIFFQCMIFFLKNNMKLFFAIFGCNFPLPYLHIQVNYRNMFKFYSKLD